MRRGKRVGAVSPEVWLEVYALDRGTCVARQLDPQASPCTGKWGDRVRYVQTGWMRPLDLTVDHIKEELLVGELAKPGPASPSDIFHLVLVCWGHHVRGGWSTSHRPLLRQYLKEHRP